MTRSWNQRDHLAHIYRYGYPVFVKTTVDISDALLEQAKAHARRSGLPLRAVIEDGLRRVLTCEATAEPYELPDCAVGEEGAPNPLEHLSWQDLRDTIYGGR